MGIREKLNENPKITTGVTAGIILLALIVIIWQAWPGGGPKVMTKAWFTVDDGKTFFTDDINKVPPFDKGGQPAVRAFVFTCDGGKTKFVAYLQRYTAEGKKKMEEQYAKRAAGQPMDPAGMEAMAQGMEMKKPNDASAPWVKQMDYEKSQRLMNVQCPNGGSLDKLESVSAE